MNTDLDKVKKLAKDLRKSYPRSPREKLGGYVIAARCVDKCRAFLVGHERRIQLLALFVGEPMVCVYRHYTGTIQRSCGHRCGRRRLARWITAHSQVKDPDEVLKWNNRLRDMRLSEMSLQAQQYLEEYIPKFVPKHRPVYVWFDVYDLEEKRLEGGTYPHETILSPARLRTQIVRISSGTFLDCPYS